MLPIGLPLCVVPSRFPHPYTDQIWRSDEFIAALQAYPGSTLDETSLLTGGLIFPGNTSTADLPTLEIGLGSLLFNITGDQCV